MKFGNNSEKNLKSELKELRNENLRLNSLLQEQVKKTADSEDNLRMQSERFALFNKFSSDLTNQTDEQLFSYIVNEFKSLFKVREAWIAIFDEKSFEMVLKATTLSETDHNLFIRKVGSKILETRTLITPEQYNMMITMGIGEPSSLTKITFGTIPELIGNTLQSLFGIGWFEGLALTDRGKLYGGLLVAGNRNQEWPRKDELRSFCEITSHILRRKDVEKELIATKLWFRDLSDLMPQLVFEGDIQGNITFINKFGLDLLGYSRENVESGLKVTDLIIDAEKDLVLSRIRDTIDGSDAIPREVKIIMKDSRIMPLLLQAKLFKEGGHVKGIRGTGIDITELIEMRELLDNERNLLRTLIDNLPDRIYAKDIESRFIICNKALIERMKKSSSDEIIGKTDMDLLPVKLASEYRNDEVKVINTGIPLVDKEELLRLESDQIQYSLTTKVPLRNKQGEIIGLVGIGKNITTRKLAELELEKKNQQLKELNTLKDKLFSILAHDLRSPFNVFLGYTQIMSEDINTLSQDEIKNIAERMKDSATNLYSLLENLLEWSKMQRDSMDFRPEQIIVIKGIKRSIGFIKDQARFKEITIETDIPEDMSMNADSHMFDTIIRNLVSNAIKFTRKGGKIRISAIKSGNDKTEFRISDTGIGISKEQVDKLFTVDQQVQRPGTDGEPSTGLGLILCKEFIEKHGGRISVESDVDRGSTFIFTL